ncbi:(2Fe-2S)-binding protein [Sphingomonas flavalba]|uniref:(2Fe-2S)-binding protein n=1 Tax=Sphingomonas flavalba TaxID=2559804 RepID=UPI0039E070CB
MRIAGTERGEPFAILVDGEEMTAFAGETIATAMLAAGRAAMRRDRSGAPRGLFCNMGTCSECLVTVRADGGAQRVRACLTPAAPGLRVETGPAA